MKEAFLLDPSCMIAAVCAWHTHHEATATEVTRRLEAGQSLAVAGPALVEAYAVLTRLPAPYRLSPADALELLDANFMARRRIVSLDGEAYVHLLRGAPSRGIYGGRTYDAAIAECAAKAQVSALLTLDEDDFRGWGSNRLKIVVPGNDARTSTP